MSSEGFVKYMAPGARGHLVGIGGVSMSGGRGSVAGTFLGALIIGIISKALPMVNIPNFWQNLIKGVIILAVVILNVVTQRTMERQNLLRREM